MLCRMGASSGTVTGVARIARIVAVADVYDALTTKRFYKEAFSHAKARQIIMDLRGTHFDPVVVDAFAAIEEQLDRIRQEKLDQEQQTSAPVDACRPASGMLAAAGS